MNQLTLRLSPHLSILKIRPQILQMCLVVLKVVTNHSFVSNFHLLQDFLLSIPKISKANIVLYSTYLQEIYWVDLVMDKDHRYMKNKC